MTAGRFSRATVLIAAVSALLLALTAARWVGEVPGKQAHLDFAPYYASALLFREGHAAQMYDPAAQTELLRASGDAPQAPVATALAPPAILLYVPLTLAPLWLASLMWSVIQCLLLLMAALIAVRAAPWAARLTRTASVVIVAAAVSGGGTLMLLGLNQWDGVAALALALTYSDLRAGRDNGAMVWLTVGVLAGKPHLAIGMALFLVARRPLSLIPGALAAAAMGGLTLLVVPLAAVGQWLGTVVNVNGAFRPSSTIGISGLVASFFGDGGASTVAGYVMTALVLLTCFALGRRAGRRDGGGSASDEPMSSIDPVFLGATLLTLLAAPHVFPYDLVTLIPGLVGCLAWGAAGYHSHDWPGRVALSVLAAWLVVTLVCLEMVSPPGSYRPTPLLPILLLASAAACVAVAAFRPRCAAPPMAAPVGRW